MKKLIVIGNYQIPISGRKFFGPIYGRFAASVVESVKQIVRQEQADFVILCPQFIADRLGGLKIEHVLWDEIGNFARRYAGTQDETFAEIFSFNEEVVRILERGSGAHVKGISIPRALSAAFTSPFSEDFPFWVAGLQSIANRFEIKEAIVFGSESPFLPLAAEALQAVQVHCRVEKKTLISLFDSLDRRIRGLGDRRAAALVLGKFKRKGRTPPQALEGPKIAMFASKPRSIRYLGPVAARLREHGKNSLILGATDQSAGESSILAPEYILGIDSYPLAKKFQSGLRDLWCKSEVSIYQLPHTYRGVRIAAHCTAGLRRIWLQRGPGACVLAELSQELFEKLELRGLLLNDMLEGSYVFSKRAEERGIPRIFYYGIYSGQIAIALLWEHYLAGIAEKFAVLNDWMGSRLVEAKIASPENVRVVGDVLSSGLGKEGRGSARAEICAALSLRKEEKIVLLLSRAVSSAMRREDKKIYFSKTDAACRALGAQLVIKGHPYENRSVLEAEVAEWNCRARILIEEQPLAKLVLAADLAVNYPASASSLDCMYAETPVVILGPQSEFEHLDLYDNAFSYKRYQAATCLNLAEDLLPPMRELLANEKARAEQVERGRKFAERISGPTDGRADARIAGWILEMGSKD